MTIRKFIKKLFVTIIMIGIVLAAVLKVGYILICKVIVMIIFAVLAIRYWVGEDIRKAEEEKMFFVKHFSLKKASEFPIFSEGFSLL